MWRPHAVPWPVARSVQVRCEALAMRQAPPQRTSYPPQTMPDMPSAPAAPAPERGCVRLRGGGMACELSRVVQVGVPVGSWLLAKTGPMTSKTSERGY